jgi:hypothetical protein
MCDDGNHIFLINQLKITQHIYVKLIQLCAMRSIDALLDVNNVESILHYKARTQ